jgi:hypothetical protein
MAPSPGGVEIAAMVSNSVVSVTEIVLSFWHKKSAYTTPLVWRGKHFDYFTAIIIALI